MGHIEKELERMKIEVDKRFEKYRMERREEILETTSDCVHEESRQPDNAPQLPTFDGKSAWEEYWTLFETAAQVHNWTKSQKASKLSLSLRGDALRVLQTIPLEERSHFDQLVGRLEMRFGQKHLVELYRSELKNRVQKEKESLQEFEGDIVRLVKMAYPTIPDDVYESLAVDRFLDGLRNIETKRAVKLARPKTISDALTQALEFEAIRQSTAGYARVRVAEANDGNEEGKFDLENIMQEILKRLGREKRQLRCWSCGKVGHVRARCQQPPNEYKTQEN